MEQIVSRSSSIGIPESFVMAILEIDIIEDVCLDDLLTSISLLEAVAEDFSTILAFCCQKNGASSLKKLRKKPSGKMEE